MNGSTFLLTGADVLTGLKNDSNLFKNDTTQITMQKIMVRKYCKNYKIKGFYKVK